MVYGASHHAGQLGENQLLAAMGKQLKRGSPLGQTSSSRPWVSNSSADHPWDKNQLLAAMGKLLKRGSPLGQKDAEVSIIYFTSSPRPV
jgi:hypothetical protein